MTTNLYDLPKDILIKLLITVREDIEKEYIEEIIYLNKKIDTFREVAPGVEVNNCDFPNCKALYCRNFETSYVKCSYMVRHFCDGLYCDKHINIHECKK